MKLFTTILLLMLSATMMNAESTKAKASFVTEIGYGVSDSPRESKYSDGVFEAISLDIAPEDFSEAMNNDGDRYIYMGYDVPMGNNWLIGVGLKAHDRDGLDWEGDFSFRAAKFITPEWSMFGGGGFGFGRLEVAFDTIEFSDGSIIDYPEKMNFSTSFFSLGTDYRLTKNWSIGTFYELKEMAVEGDDLKEQVNWQSGGDALKTAQAISSYESTTHSLYFYIKCTF